MYVSLVTIGWQLSGYMGKVKYAVSIDIVGFIIDIIGIMGVFVMKELILFCICFILIGVGAFNYVQSGSKIGWFSFILGAVGILLLMFSMLFQGVNCG